MTLIIKCYKKFQLTSDIYFTYGVAFVTKMMAAKNKKPIYEYLFSYNSTAGFVKNLFKVEEGIQN